MIRSIEDNFVDFVEFVASFFFVALRLMHYRLAPTAPRRHFCLTSGLALVRYAPGVGQGCTHVAFLLANRPAMSRRQSVYSFGSSAESVGIKQALTGGFWRHFSGVRLGKGRLFMPLQSEAQKWCHQESY